MIKKVIDKEDWNEITKILSNVAYWDTCPDDYINSIEKLLLKYNENKQRSE